MNGQFFSQFPGHHHFTYIRRHIDEQTNGENHDAFAQRVCQCKNGCIPQPENNYSGIQGIDNKSGSKNFEHLSSAQMIGMLTFCRLQNNFFEKEKIYAHGDQKSTPAIPD